MLSFAVSVCADPVPRGGEVAHTFRRLPPVADDTTATAESDSISTEPEVLPEDVAPVIPQSGILTDSDNAEPITAPENGLHQQLPALMLPPNTMIQSPRANFESQELMSDYQSRVDATPRSRCWIPDIPATLPPSYIPWWDEQMQQPLAPVHESLSVDLAQLCDEALRHSSYVQVITAEPDIRSLN